MNKSFYTIKVLDQGGNFYDNAFIADLLGNSVNVEGLEKY